VLFPRRGTRTHSRPLTVREILEIGLGELGMNPDDLYDYTMRELHDKLEGARKIENLRSREEWERTRELAFTVAQFSGNLKKGATKHHIMQFPWDEKKNRSYIANLSGEERKQAAKELFEARKETLANFLKNQKN
jgi:hypothetical protein